MIFHHTTAVLPVVFGCAFNKYELRKYTLLEGKKVDADLSDSTRNAMLMSREDFFFNC